MICEVVSAYSIAQYWCGHRARIRSGATGHMLWQGPFRRTEAEAQVDLDERMTGLAPVDPTDRRDG